MEKPAQIHMVGYKKTPPSLVKLEFFQLPFSGSAVLLGSKSAVSTWLLSVFLHVTLEGGEHLIMT